MSGLGGLSATLWPIRYKPFDDELLSSWLVRLAHGHGMKVQPFCNLVFGSRFQVWNRDVDRLGPDWILDKLTIHTGTSRERAQATTLRVYEGSLFSRFQPSGGLKWIQSLQMYHRKRLGLGQQYCPACLAEDPVPYFRKSWRLALKTLCTRHHCLLRDCCPHCGAGISFHRMDTGRFGPVESGPLSNCHECNGDLADVTHQPPVTYDAEASNWLSGLIREVDAAPDGELPPRVISELVILHHVIRLMLTLRKTMRLREHVCDCLDVKDVELVSGKRVLFEGLNLQARHHLLQLGSWLLVDPATRLGDAVRARAMRHNHLCVDMKDPPRWYRDQVVSAIETRAKPGMGLRCKKVSSYPAPVGLAKVK